MATSIVRFYNDFIYFLFFYLRTMFFYLSYKIHTYFQDTNTKLLCVEHNKYVCVFFAPNGINCLKYVYYRPISSLFIKKNLLLSFWPDRWIKLNLRRDCQVYQSTKERCRTHTTCNALRILVIKVVKYKNKNHGSSLEPSKLSRFS